MDRVDLPEPEAGTTQIQSCAAFISIVVAMDAAGQFYSRTAQHRSVNRMRVCPELERSMY